MLTESDKQAAINALCTHTCALRPNLKLNPRHCDRRRELAGQTTSALETYPGWDCLECTGPIPRTPQGPQEENAAMEASTSRPSVKSRIKKCRTCGKTEDDGAMFYPTSPGECASCHTDRTRQRRRAASERVKVAKEHARAARVTPAVELPAPVLALKESPPPPYPDLPKTGWTGTPYQSVSELEPTRFTDADLAWTTMPDINTCIECGAEFDPWLSGRSMQTKNCKACIAAKRTATARARGTATRKGLGKRGSKNPTITPKNPTHHHNINPTINPEIPTKPYLPAAVLDAIRNTTDADMPKFDVLSALKRRLNGNMVLVDFTRVPWALAWLREQGQEDVSKDLCMEICQRVPAEWLKAHLLSVEGA